MPTMIQAEGINGPSGDRGYSETARYQDFFDSDQINSSLAYSDIAGTGTPRVGNLIAMTEVASNPKQGWSHKPPVQVAAAPRVEMFRKGVRLVNASNLFPTGPVANPSCNTATSPAYLGVTVSTENPVYVFGNYNAPCGRGIDDGDPYPGIAVTPVVGGATSLPTSPGDYIGHNLRTCGTNCHVPAAVVGDAVTLLSGPNVGTSNTNWGGANGFGGWMDTRSFIMPYQALRYRTARNTVYRFAMVSGFTPSWFSGFWGDPDSNQGGTSQQSSGALNNFPRFLEDWGKNGNGNDFCTYSGSLIRIYKSQQANGAFKRVSNAGVAWSNAGGGSPVDYVYRPPNRDWVFDIDFNAPCLLPPGSPFLQLIDFKGFQQSQVQQK
ncbi:MAG: hypothetical protein JNN15_19830 [Blastocatellia bacterium]|nr:hypothetical protein [Blastocatellia bacterium]